MEEKESKKEREKEGKKERKKKKRDREGMRGSEREREREMNKERETNEMVRAGQEACDNLVSYTFLTKSMTKGRNCCFDEKYVIVNSDSGYIFF